MKYVDLHDETMMKPNNCFMTHTLIHTCNF